jgi:hypothetical protein
MENQLAAWALVAVLFMFRYQYAPMMAVPSRSDTDRARFIARRLPRQPARSTSVRGAPASSHTSRAVAWVALVIAGIAFGLRINDVFPLVALTPLLLPPLLVHSGYLAYNFPGHLPLYALVVCASGVVLTRLISGPGHRLG